jgi:hypothetical protein
MSLQRSASIKCNVGKSLPVPALLQAGRKFCKITKNRPNKKLIGRENLAAVQPPILDKSGREKKIG